MCIYIYIYVGIHCSSDPNQCFQVARFRDVVQVSEMLCTFPSSCARFTAQQLCTFHKPPNNVLGRPNKTKFSDMCVYIYIAHINKNRYTEIYIISGPMTHSTVLNGDAIRAMRLIQLWTVQIPSADLHLCILISASPLGILYGISLNLQLFFHVHPFLPSFYVDLAHQRTSVTPCHTTAAAHRQKPNAPSWRLVTESEFQ